MIRFLTVFSVFVLATIDVFAATGFMPKRSNPSAISNNTVYPYILNNAQKNNYKTGSSNTINSTGTSSFGKRGVVKRTTNARAGVNVQPKPSSTTASQRRVVQRPQTARAATSGNMRTTPVKNTVVRSAAPMSARATTVRSATKNATTNSEKVSSARCMSDYKDCMEAYCKREDTAYNRCYCSAKLTQIDSKYQNKIDDLIQQIIRLQYSENVTDSGEIKEYWDKTIGSYTGTNPWVNLENALNIDWADTQSRVRGQNAFNTGHEYCLQHLRACSYMSMNLRDAYKSEIARDCATYEQGLQKIQDAAESVIKRLK